MLQVGAIYIWSYVYIIMRTFANNNIGEPSVRTGALVPSQESTSSDGHSDYIELPQTSMGEAKVFLALLYIYTGILILATLDESL